MIRNTTKQQQKAPFWKVVRKHLLISSNGLEMWKTFGLFVHGSRHGGYI
jgi:hypothetical protein